MTWLPLTDSTSDRHAVLDLLPQDVSDTLHQFLAVADDATDRELLALCRARMAQTLGCRAELAELDANLLDRLEDWYSSDAFSARERAALDYTDQFVLAAMNVSPAQRTALAEALGVSEPSTFVYGLYINEAYLRFLAFFDVEPYRGGEARIGAAGDGVGAKTDREFLDWVDDQESETDPRILGAYYAFGRAICREHLVDDTTDELVRLRSAEYHGCQFCQSVRRDIAPVEGVSDLMDEARDYRTSTHVTPAQRVALEALDAMCLDPSHVSADLRAAILEQFSPAQIVELLMKEVFWMSNKPMISLGTDPGAVSSSDLTAFKYDEEGNFALMGAGA